MCNVGFLFATIVTQVYGFIWHETLSVSATLRQDSRRVGMFRRLSLLCGGVSPRRGAMTLARSRVRTSVRVPPRGVRPRVPGFDAAAVDDAAPHRVRAGPADAAAPATMPLDLKECVLESAETVTTEVPSVVDAAPAGFQWHFLANVRSYSLAPTTWSSFAGSGAVFGMHADKAVVCEDAHTPSPEAPVTVGLSVTVYRGAFTQMAVKATPDGLCEFFTALHMLRAAPASQRQPGDFAAGGPTSEETLNAARIAMGNLQAPASVHDSLRDSVVPPSGPLPDVVESWKQEITAGVWVIGLEYRIAHSDVVDTARRAGGTHYYLCFVVNQHENFVAEVEFRAPAAEWRDAWASYGHMCDSLLVNWHDGSPANFA